MPILMFPEPQDWQSGQRKVAWAVAVSVVLLGWFAYVVIETALRGHVLTAAVVLGWTTPVLTALAALALINRGLIHMEADFDASGTTMGPDVRVGALLLGGFAIFIPAGVLYVVLVPLDALDLSMSRGMRVFSPIAMAFTVVLALTGLVLAWRRGGMGYLKLRESGLVYADIVSEKSISWDDVIAIQGHSETKKTRKAVVLCGRDETEEVIDGLNLYVPNGVGLYWMVWHYWRHPGDRAELTDGRALERLEAGRFDTSVP